MAGVYSYRFVQGNGGGPFLYTVPAGKRAVVKQISAVNFETFVVGCYATIGGGTVWFRSVPGPGSVEVSGVMFVVNAGEAFGLQTGGGSLGMVACGYLLDTLP